MNCSKCVAVDAPCAAAQIERCLMLNISRDGEKQEVVVAAAAAAAA